MNGFSKNKSRPYNLDYCYICNIACYLKKLAWAPMLKMIDEREATIRKSLEEARVAQEEAQKLLEGHKAKLERASEDANEIIEKGKTDAVKMRDEIVQKARDEAKRIVEDGKTEIIREKQQALNEIKDLVADIAVNAAGQIIKVSITDQQQKEIVAQFMDNIPEAKA